jgi:hypothetical protein
MTAKIREKLQSQFHNNNDKYKNKQNGKSLHRLPYPLQPQLKFDNMDIIQYNTRSVYTQLSLCPIVMLHMSILYMNHHWACIKELSKR